MIELSHVGVARGPAGSRSATARAGLRRQRPAIAGPCGTSGPWPVRAVGLWTARAADFTLSALEPHRRRDSARASRTAPELRSRTWAVFSCWNARSTPHRPAGFRRTRGGRSVTTVPMPGARRAHVPVSGWRRSCSRWRCSVPSARGSLRTRVSAGNAVCQAVSWPCRTAGARDRAWHRPPRCAA